MAVLRINKKEKNFLILDKNCINDTGLSWGAKGLHTYLMSLPQDWKVHVKDLRNRATNGRDSVRALLSELEKAGYISRGWVRDEQTGKYTCLEYIVHEAPELSTVPDDPGPGMPSPDYQAPGNPSPENPTLININNNKYTKNKVITAAGISEDKKINREAAAVLFDKHGKNSNIIPTLSQKDAVIGEQLTVQQQKRIDALIQKLDVDDKDRLREEVEHCLLHSHYFKACGLDFSRKLNAIRAVILKGEWQTPAELILSEKEKADTKNQEMEAELNAAIADLHHFQQRLSYTKDWARENLESIIKTTQDKVQRLVSELKHESHIEQQGRARYD